MKMGDCVGHVAPMGDLGHVYRISIVKRKGKET